MNRFLCACAARRLLASAESFALTAVAFALTAGPAWAIDSVKKLEGATASGTITGMTTNDVTIKPQIGENETVPVTNIDYVTFTGEPAQLPPARRKVGEGKYAEALADLEKAKPDASASQNIKHEVQFYKALCQVRLVMEQAAGANPEKARLEMSAFVNEAKSNFHWLAANEAMGDLELAMKQFDKAAPYYDELAKSNFPEFKMKAGVNKGRVLVAQGKYAEAQAEYEKVLSLAGNTRSALADRQRFAASVGKANCLGLGGNPDEGIKLVEELIKNLPPEEAAMQAQAYVVLGNCYRKKDATKEALLAYLHVDVLYPNQAVAEDEALGNLIELWTKLNKPERAVECQARRASLSRGGR